jgi:hypothetical protein
MESHLRTDRKESEPIEGQQKTIVKLFEVDDGF